VNSTDTDTGDRYSHFIAGWSNQQAGGVESEKLMEGMRQAARSTLHSVSKISAKTACASTVDVLELKNGGKIGITGHPHWHDSNLSNLAARNGHAAALSEAYHEHGTDCLEQLQGAFAIAIIDPVSRRVMLATDRTGQCPIYYSRMDTGIAFGSAASIVLAHNRTRTLRAQGLYDYVYFHMVPSPLSIYENVEKLPAGHVAIVEGGSLSVSPWFRPEFRERSSRSMDELKQDLRRVLRDAVSTASESEGNIAAFLSGGLDSSSVTGMLAQVSEQSAHAYSIGFSAEGYDEMEYARLTAKHFGVQLHEYYVTPEDVVNALPRIAASYDEPFGNSSALPAYFCAQLAANDGVNCLLAGDGGDELFGGNERYVKQFVFERYGKVPKLLRRGVLEPIIKVLPGKIPLAEKARSYIDQANTQLPGRLQSYNFLHRHAAEEVFASDFLTNVDTSIPLQLLEKTYHEPADASSLNRMLYLDWQYTLADNDLRKVSHMCALAGVDVRYPMLDDRLIELSTRIPSQWKIRDGELRHYYKESMKGWLPDATINKQKHGFGLPFGVWMETHKPLQDMAYDNLIALKKRGIFRQEFIDQTIHMHRNQHSAYYGELVWILMVLELWLSAHTAVQPGTE
tara:strand:+ start:18476 stop:20350 length:1875 start_codon:yes stop_codon:yes gene_type:complete